MRSDLPMRIAIAARSAARLDYRIEHLEAMVESGSDSYASQRARTEQVLRLVRLRRNLARADLERMRNELHLVIVYPDGIGGRDAA